MPGKIRSTGGKIALDPNVEFKDPIGFAQGELLIARQEDVVILICEDDLVPLHCERADCQQWLVYLHDLESNIELTNILADKDGGSSRAQVVHHFPAGNFILCADLVRVEDGRPRAESGWHHCV